MIYVLFDFSNSFIALRKTIIVQNVHNTLKLKIHIKAIVSVIIFVMDSNEITPIIKFKPIVIIAVFTKAFL